MTKEEEKKSFTKHTTDDKNEYDTIRDSYVQLQK